VGEAARELAQSGKYNVRLAAIGILATDYPHLLLPHAAAWSSRRNPLSVRLRVIEGYAALRPPDLAAFLERLVLADERVVVKVTALHLLREHAPDHLADVLVKMWPTERTTVIRRIAMEMLFQVDRERAMRFILSHGLTSTRAGVRVDACAILAAEPSVEITSVLLERLRKDHSQWVRIQALRSLASPGRGVAREELFQATESEIEEHVLAVRRELLGV
jgi:HEAT repeat protein